MLRRKRAGRVEEAGALSARIGQAIQRRCRTQLSRYDGKTDAGSMWAAVRRLTGRQATLASVDGITAETLNRHYADISTDPQYTEPALKQSTQGIFQDLEYGVCESAHGGQAIFLISPWHTAHF